MRRQDVLGEPAVAADVHRGDDRSVRVVLDRHRARVAGAAVDELGERDDAVVANPVAPVEAHDTREIALLDPQLGTEREIVQEVRHDRVRLQARTLDREAEVLLRDVARDEARVVAKAVHRSRVARRAVLAQARRALRDVPCEVDPRNGDALPVRRQSRQPAVVDRRDAERRQVAERRTEPRRHDQLVALEHEAALPARSVHHACDSRAESRSIRSIAASTTWLPEPPRTCSSNGCR